MSCLRTLSGGAPRRKCSALGRQERSGTVRCRRSLVRRRLRRPLTVEGDHKAPRDGRDATIERRGGRKAPLADCGKRSGVNAWRNRTDNARLRYPAGGVDLNGGDWEVAPRVAAMRRKRPCVSPKARRIDAGTNPAWLATVRIADGPHRQRAGLATTRIDSRPD